MANPSVETIIGISRNLLRAEAGSDLPVIADAFMIQAVAEADREARRAFRKGGGNAPVEAALEFGPTLVADTAVNDATDVQTSDVTVTVDSTTGFDAAGAAAFWTDNMPDVFFYTSLSATVFSGVTGIGSPHNDDDAVQALYALPSNFGTFRRAEGYGDGVQLNGSGLTYTSGIPTSGQFSMRDDGTTKYLWLPRGSTGNVSVLFDRDSNTIDSTDDLISLPEDWQFFYAWRAVELALFGRGDYPIIPQAKANADRIKLDLLKDRNVGRRLRVRTYATHDYEHDLALRENAL